MIDDKILMIDPTTGPDLTKHGHGTVVVVPFPMMVSELRRMVEDLFPQPQGPTVTVDDNE